MSTRVSEPAAPARLKRNGPNRYSRRWLPYAGAVVLVTAIVAGLWPKPVPVEVAPVQKGPLRVTVNEEGKTRITQRFVVSAPVTGQLRRIPFKAGAEVRGGETVVAIIDPVPPTPLDARTRSQLEARREAALANIEKAKAARDFAVSELRRNRQLFSEKTVSAQDLEAAELREAAAAKDVDAAESALRQVEAELAEFNPVFSPTNSPARPPREVMAPATGSILRVFEENARVVTAGTPLVEIGDPADLEVIIETLSRDGAAVPPGAHVEFEQWGGTEPLVGKVRLVEPAAFTKISALGVEEQRVYVVADLVTPPEQRRNVGDNFRVEARIVIWQTDSTLKVPAGALFRHGEKWAVFVMANGRAQLREVTAGRSSGTETQVLEGLKEGEQVILYPGSRVKAGQRVRPITI